MALARYCYLKPRQAYALYSRRTMARVVLVGIGGASCSGKTTLARHLASILPQCYLVHQDDYAPSEELIPFHPTHKIRDWDAAPTAIKWDRFIRDLQATKEGESLDESRKTHEHINLLTPVPVPEALSSKWKERFVSSHNASSTKYIIIEGFLMFWHPAVHSLLDVRLLVRSSRETINARRSARNERISDASFWKDPPGCFENIVWPAYEDAHRRLFEGGDVDKGSPKPDAAVTLLETDKTDMAGMVETACRSILQYGTA